MRSNAVAVALALALTLAAGCQKKPPEPAATPAVVDAPAPPPPVAPDLDPVLTEMRQNFERVFFAFDSAALTDEAIGHLQANATLLTSNPDVRVQIQGHADERGTTDYNLALAQERAAKVRDTLVGMGVSANALQIVSFGEERPLADASQPVAWSMNRRAEFLVTRDPNGNLTSTIDAPPPTVDEVVLEENLELAPPQ